MKKILNWAFAFLLLSGVGSVTAQSQTQEVNDPKATALLKKVKANYESYATITANFTLTIQSEDENLKRTGTLYKKASKFKMISSDYDLLSDGKSMWLVIKNSCQVNISNLEDGGNGMISPSELLDIYKNNDYLYAITGESVENGKNVFQIEFKPKKYNEDLTKMRASIDKNTNLLVKVMAFGRYGDRYIFDINKMTPNQPLSDNLFVFAPGQYKAACPDLEIIDLREE